MNSCCVENSKSLGFSAIAHTCSRSEYVQNHFSRERSQSGFSMYLALATFYPLENVRAVVGVGHCFLGGNHHHTPVCRPSEHSWKSLSREVARVGSHVAVVW